MEKKDDSVYVIWKGASDLADKLFKRDLVCTCARQYDDNLWIKLGLEIAAAVQYERNFVRALELAKRREAYEAGIFKGMDSAGKE